MIEKGVSDKKFKSNHQTVFCQGHGWLDTRLMSVIVLNNIIITVHIYGHIYMKLGT